MNSLTEALNAAFDEVEQSADQTSNQDDVTTNEVHPEPDTQDTAVIDKPEDSDTGETQQAEEQNVANTQQAEEYKPIFNGYSNEEKEILSKLPQDVQKIVDGRQVKFEQGIHKYQEIARENQEKASIADEFHNIIGQDADILKQYNVTPSQYFQNLVTVERQLRSQDPRVKLSAIYGIAHDYGIDLELLPQVQFDPRAHQLQKQVDAQQAQLAAVSTNAQKAEIGQLRDVISTLSGELEYFNELQPMMVQVIESGLVAGSTPEEIYRNAYQKALRLDDTVFNKMQASQQAKKLSEAQKANLTAQSAKSKSTSIKGGSPAGKTVAQKKATTFEQVEESFRLFGL